MFNSQFRVSEKCLIYAGLTVFMFYSSVNLNVKLKWPCSAVLQELIISEISEL